MSETNQIFQDIHSFAGKKKRKKGNPGIGRRNMNRTRRGKCRKLINFFSRHTQPAYEEKKETDREEEHE